MVNNPLTSTSGNKVQAKKEPQQEKTIFFAEDMTVMYYDHPNFTAKVLIPDEYKPLTRIEQLIELEQRRLLTDDMKYILKVVGDALCANESQIKRYMKLLTEKFGTSHTSRLLTGMRKYGLVEKFSTRIAFMEEEDGDYRRQPAPYTLGFAGIKYLQHFYSEMTFVQPETWRSSHAAIQRYIALNELRCCAAESRNLKKWVWHPQIGGLNTLPVPLAVAQVKYAGKENDLQLIFERAQSNMDYLAHLKRRLDLYNSLINKHQRIQILDFSDNQPKVVVISCGTLQMAKQITTQLELHKYPYPIWFVLDEWLPLEQGMSGAFAQLVAKDGSIQLQRFQVPIFNKANN